MARKNIVIKVVKRHLVWFALVVLVTTTALAVLFIRISLGDRIYPKVSIASVGVGLKTKQEALATLEEKIKLADELVLVADAPDSGRVVFKMPLVELGFSYDFEDSVDKALRITREGNIFERIMSIFKPIEVELSYKLNEELLDENIAVIAGQISKPAVYPRILLQAGMVIVERGSAGDEVLVEDLKQQILENLSRADFQEIQVRLARVNPSLSDQESSTAYNRALTLKDKRLIFTFENQSLEFAKADLISFINPSGGYNQKYIDEQVKKIADQFNREPQNPTFIFNGERVEEFTPAKEGVSIKQIELKQKILESLIMLENQNLDQVEITVPYLSFEPEFRTEDVNNLGIKELIGQGESFFRGSAPSRVYNINLAASRLNGILIKPGEIFSFNQALGDVSKFSGYKEAYVIQNGKTVLGDGGGVCQVSTTLFRAALNAGLPIVERRAHSYRVSYYEQNSPPGLDATVYAPTTDLKILNDTGNHILIQTKVDTKNMSLVFELYGRSDGRKATVSRPVISENTPPPEDLYIDDPSLPIGEIKQIDFKAWGAKVSFNYVVERNGEKIYEKTFYSNYRPWQAKFLRGIAPIE